jgi:hypothetical protein
VWHATKGEDGSITTHLAAARIDKERDWRPRRNRVEVQKLQRDRVRRVIVDGTNKKTPSLGDVRVKQIRL